MMSITFTGVPPLPDLGDEATFNTRAQNLFAWYATRNAGSFLTQIEALDAADYFSIASKAQAEAGTDNTKILTALRTKQAIDQFAATKAQGEKADEAIPAPAAPVAGDLLIYTGAGSGWGWWSLRKGANGQVLKQGPTYAAWGAAAVGDGQTWQDMSASRALGTSYQNTTGRAIQVSIQSAWGGGDRSMLCSSNGISWVTIFTLSGDRTIPRGAQIIVPAGHYYRVTGSGYITNWAELR